CISTKPSGACPLTASGPSATFPVHPARESTHALTSVRRTSISFHVYLIIEPPPLFQALTSPLGQLRTGQRYYATTRSGIHPLGGGCPLARPARTVVIVTATTAKSLISAFLRCDRTTANVSVLGPTCSADRAPAAGSTRCAVEAGSVAL